MSYIVNIQNRSRNGGISKVQSIPLPNKERVTNFIKKNPLANWNTTIKVTNTINKKIILGKKSHFYNPERW